MVSYDLISYTLFFGKNGLMYIQVYVSTYRVIPYSFIMIGKHNTAIWVKSQHLTAEDREDILKGKKLQDRVINTVQDMIKCQHPDQNGLRDTVVLEGAQTWDDVPQRFVQIVFDRSRKHWICASNMFSEEVVEIFDSAPPKKFTVSDSIRRQLAVIMKTQKDSFEVRSVKDLM